jgi:glucose/mannose transport system substrate-binding protein
MKPTQNSNKQREEIYRQLKAGRISRREFMRAIALLGISFGAGTMAAQCGARPEGAVEAVSADEAEIEPTALIEEEALAALSQLEIISGWLGGAQEEALQVLYDIYRREYPEVEIITAMTLGAAGFQLNEAIASRMQGNQPPDSFQVHLGHELIDNYAVAGQMEPLDFLYAEEGWHDLFPPDLLTIASWDGQPWSAPVNIHRSNVLWWNTRLFQEAGLDAPPETFDEFFTAAARLKDAGFDPIVFGASGPPFSGHVFESILAAHFTPDQYRGLWTGVTDWRSSEVEESLMILKEMLVNFANDDYRNLDWGAARNRFREDSTGMMIMGDWENGEFKAAGFTNYSWAPAMGTQGIFIVLSDSFSLPRGAPHRENAINWLRVCGSKEGQEKFNVIKGSIPARTDIDPSRFDAYQQSAIEDFKVDALVPSVVHGAAAKESWAVDFVTTLNTFAHNKDIKQAQESLARACEEAGVCG